MTERISSLFIILFLAFSVYAQTSDRVEFSLKAGYYDTIQSLILTAPNASPIYYTTNGSPPSKRSKKYIKPLLLDSTVVVRATVYTDSGRAEISTNTYFFGVDSTSFAIISLSIDASVLFDPNRGLFSKGPFASDTFPYRGANFYRHIEKPCYVELYESGHQKVFEGKLGFKVFGGMSRIFPQKSFALHASKRTYGTPSIDHQIFSNRKNSSFKKIVLRNSGSDFGETHFRDALITSFGEDMGLEVQAYRPSIVYINGMYWGIYNIREKLTRHFIAENLGISKDSIDLIEHRKDIKSGTRKHYDRMLAYMKGHDLSNDAHYKIVDSLMDIDNFLAFQIMEIYIDNQDAGGNIKFWRSQSEGRKWRWILFDTDFGLGHYGWRGYKNNSLVFHTKADGPKWPNPPWSTFILRKLLENKRFQKQFVASFLDHMNFTLDSTRIVQRIDQFIKRIEGELPRHWKRWSLSSKTWLKNVNRMKTFARERPVYMRQHLQSYFSWLGKPYSLQIAIDSGGIVWLNQKYKLHRDNDLTYMSGSKIELDVLAYEGYQFSHWKINDSISSDLPLIIVEADSVLNIRPVFTKITAKKSSILINEICFADTNTGDWIELYNTSDLTINLDGWRITDGSDRMYVFDKTEIVANAFLVLTKEDVRFRQYHTDTIPSLGVLPFGLSKRTDCIKIYSDRGMMIDSFRYDIKKKKRGKCTGISLNDFSSSKKGMKPWKYNEYDHSPGRMNPEHVKLLRKREEKLFKERIKIAAVLSLPFFSLMLGLGFYRSKRKKATHG